jgi:translation initiation factor IF-3
VPVPRRFDRRPPERDTTRVNERIRVPEVRVIGDDGQQVGVMKTDQALRMAQERDLDLVEVAPEARPPVVRILDYSKYKYEQAQKIKQARKHQQQIVIREIKFRPKIAQHDYDTKKGHVERFLRHKDKVKITIMFRGREVTHPERGRMILDRLAEELQELATIEQRPNLDGRNMTMMLGPSRAVLAGTLEEGAEAEGEAPVDAEGTTPTDAAVETTATDDAAAEAPEAEATESDDDAAEAPEAEATATDDAAAAEAPEAEATDSDDDDTDTAADAAEAPEAEAATATAEAPAPDAEPAAE